MYLLLNGTTINAASDVPPQKPAGFSVVETPGDVETYNWPNGEASRCLYVDGAIVANPAHQPYDEKEAEAAGLLADRALKAYILCINDGSIVPGSNMTPAKLEAAIKAKL